MNIDLSAPVVSGIVLIAFVAVIHMSFQLAMSVLTLLSGHSLMHRRATQRLLVLNSAFIAGAALTTLLLLVAFTTLATLWIDPSLYAPAWLVLFGVTIIVAMLTMIVYYRDGKGTQLWIPRSLADYLTNRAKRTTNAAEAVALGIMSTVAELPFTAILLALTALALSTTVNLDLHSVMICIYTIASVLPLIIITVLLSGGHRLSTIQRWRESSKVFLQYAAGVGLLVVALYLMVFYIIIPERL